MTIDNEQGNKNKWIWIGLGAALLFCCCAVLAAYLVFKQAGQTLQEGMKTDPESAAKAAHEIADYDLPPGYQEQMAMDIMFYSFVIIAPDTNNTSPSASPLIMLAQFSQAGMDRKQMEQQLRQSFEQQFGQRGADMQVVEVKTMVIRGEEVEVTIFEGTDANGYVLRQLVTSFPGKDGTAMLMIMGAASAWDDNVIDDFIESIR